MAVISGIIIGYGLHQPLIIEHPYYVTRNVPYIVKDYVWHSMYDHPDCQTKLTACQSEWREQRVRLKNLTSLNK